ncbi:MAG TPA: hypothetical protein VJZ72_12120 [Candidatus Limnocylindrales bacterium]|nr:hypothetical protein [Candidatus Limnocylindrales bacterium]
MLHARIHGPIVESNRSGGVAMLSDPTGIRRLLRHYFGRSTAVISVSILVAASLMGLGDRRGRRR